jgi:hypothetical protein
MPSQTRFAYFGVIALSKLGSPTSCRCRHRANVSLSFPRYRKKERELIIEFHLATT